MQIYLTSAAPEIIHHRAVDPELIRDEEILLTITMKRLKENFEGSPFRQDVVLEDNKAHVESDWEDVVEISPEFAEHRDKLISVLDKHQHMCDGHLRTIHATYLSYVYLLSWGRGPCQEEIRNQAFFRTRG